MYRNQNAVRICTFGILSSNLVSSIFSQCVEKAELYQPDDYGVYYVNGLQKFHKEYRQVILT